MVRVPDVTEAVPELRVHFRAVPIFASVASTVPCPMFSPSIRFQGVQMAARFLAVFSKLGTTQTGSSALGQTLVDFFALAREAVAKHTPM